MRFKPKEVMVNLPAVYPFESEDDVVKMAASFNSFVFGKVKMKYEILGNLGGQIMGLFYIQRNHESQQLRDEFMQLIHAEEMNSVSDNYRSHSGICPVKIHNENCTCKSCMGM